MILILTALEIEANAIRRVVDPSDKVHPIGIGARYFPSTVDSPFVLLCGLAGALDPGLGIGDVVIDDRWNLVPPSRELIEGSIHTASEVVSTPEQKSELFKKTRAVAVDMEQSIVQTWCDRRGLPLIALRAISDTAYESVDPAVLNFVDDLGRPRPMKIAAGLARKPTLIPQMMRLKANTRIALDKLGPALKIVLDTIRLK